MEFAAEMADAAVAKAKAEAAAAAAAESQQKAATSETNAKTSEKNAKQSEETAVGAAEDAEQLAQAAAGSAGAAALSEQNAKTSETNAGNAADAAVAAADAAEEAEQNAAASEEAAAQSADEAKKAARESQGVLISGTAQPGQLLLVESVSEDGKLLNCKAVDRTHYETDPITVEILPETVVQFSNGEAALALLNLVAGEVYTVLWGGTAYECTAMEAYSDGISAVFVGNTLIAGGEDNGIPFAIGDIPAQGMAACVVVSGDPPAAVGITQTKRELKKMDNKFIDAEWMATTYVEDIEIVAEQELEKSSWQGNENVDFTAPSGLDLNALAAIQPGDKCTITWNGAAYEIVAVDFGVYDTSASGYLLLGNGSIMGEGVAVGTNYPFGILTDCETVIYVVGTDEEATSATLGIIHHKKGYNKLPFGYLPEEVSFPLFNFMAMDMEPVPTLGTVSLEVGEDVVNEMMKAAQGGAVRVRFEAMFVAASGGSYQKWFDTIAIAGVSKTSSSGVWKNGFFNTVLELSGEYHAVTFRFSGSTVSASAVRLHPAPVLTSPNGTKYKLVVADDGTLSTEAVTT